MQPSEQIKLLCLKMGITVSELARRLGKSPQSLFQKLNRESITLSDLENIAIVTGCKVQCCFVLPSDEKIMLRG